MRVGQSLAVTIGLLLLFAIVGIGLALLASAELNNRRQLLLEEIGPSLRSAIKLEDALVNEENWRARLCHHRPAELPGTVPARCRGPS